MRFGRYVTPEKLKECAEPLVEYSSREDLKISDHQGVPLLVHIANNSFSGSRPDFAIFSNTILVFELVLKKLNAEDEYIIDVTKRIYELNKRQSIPFVKKSSALSWFSS